MKRNKFFIVLLCVFFIYSIFGFTFIKNDQGFPTIDAPNHALFCLNFSQNAKEILNNSSISLIDKARAFKEILSSGIVYWPKFVYLTTLPFIWLFGATAFAIKSTNIIYLFIIMIFSYLLSLQLGAKKK